MSDCLSFFPADDLRCETLSPAQIRQYNQEGYISGLTIFDHHEAELNRLYFDGLLTRVLNSGRDSYAINSYQAKCAGIYDICKDTRITRIIKDILGPDFVCWSSHLFCKLPGDPKRIAWHQDAPHWPLAPSKTVTAWLAIDKIDQGNGAMRVIPGSHRDGIYSYRSDFDDATNLLNHSVALDVEATPSVFLELAAGEISIHSDLLLHSSEPNMSSRQRCGLAIRYAATDVVAGNGWNANSILCMGKNPFGRWADINRPQTEDLSPWRRPWNQKPNETVDGQR